MNAIRSPGSSAIQRQIRAAGLPDRQDSRSPAPRHAAGTAPPRSRRRPRRHAGAAPAGSPARPAAAYVSSTISGRRPPPRPEARGLRARTAQARSRSLPATRPCRSIQSGRAAARPRRGRPRALSRVRGAAARASKHPHEPAQRSGRPSCAPNKSAAALTAAAHACRSTLRRRTPHRSARPGRTSRAGLPSDSGQAKARRASPGQCEELLQRGEHHLEQRMPRHRPGRRQLLDQPLEGDVLMREGGQARLPHPRHDLQERRVAGQVGPDHQRVDGKHPISSSSASSVRPAIADPTGMSVPAPSRDSGTASAACSAMNGNRPANNRLHDFIELGRMRGGNHNPRLIALYPLRSSGCRLPRRSRCAGTIRVRIA